MWPFGKKRAPEPPVGQPGPMDVLFANYVLDVIGHLPAERRSGVEALAPKLQASLRTSASDWRGIIREALHLSQTIDLAILDLWFTNSDRAVESGVPLPPGDFAMMFVAKYREPGSQIDVWPGDSLERAKAFVAARRREPVQ